MTCPRMWVMVEYSGRSVRRPYQEWNGIVVMLSRLSRGGRWKAAVLLTLAYALCTLAPAASFAFGDGTLAAHCLTINDHDSLSAHSHKHQHSAGVAHTHADGTSQVHAEKVAAPTAHSHGHNAGDGAKSGGHGKTSDGNCCGLMCVIALPAGLPDGNLPDLLRAAAVSSVLDGAAGQPAARLDRPPNSPLPL